MVRDRHDSDGALFGISRCGPWQVGLGARSRVFRISVGAAAQVLSGLHSVPTLKSSSHRLLKRFQKLDQIDQFGLAQPFAGDVFGSMVFRKQLGQ